MKAISLHQPWAQLAILGLKRFETRSWKTAYRGPLVIHAAKKVTDVAIACCGLQPFKSVLAHHGIGDYTELPRGCLLGVVMLDEIHATENEASMPTLNEMEKAFGNFSPGRWAWLLQRPRQFMYPIPYRGCQGLFDVNHDLLPEAAEYG